MDSNNTPKNNSQKKVQNPLSALNKSPPYKIGQVADWVSHIPNEIQRKLMGKTLKPMQQAIITCNIKNDVLINLPTGFGKSMLYQFPASLLKRQTIIVFVPLRALLWDSVHQACLHGIDAAEPTESIISAYFNKNKLPALMFLTPQKFFRNQSVRHFFSDLHANKLIFKFVIDEAHCVSQWGSDFRPDFLNVTGIREYFPNVKILAMSATIPAEARADLIQKMHMKGCYYFQASYNRPNLYYEILQIKRKEIVDEIFQYLDNRNLREQCGIIYCQTIKLCTEVYEQLKKIEARSALFHSQVIESQRKDIFDKFKCGRVKMMVSTICFGMGVNKRDIRYVINVGVSSSVENYYQQSGRAGRDGKKSYCLLLTYNRDDAGIVYLTEKSEAPKAVKKRKLLKIQTMKEYAASFECRKQILFEMLGQKFSRKDCKGSCDICNKELTANMDEEGCEMPSMNDENVDVVDFTQQAVKIARNLQQQDKKFTKKQLNDYLRNKKNKKSDAIPFAPQFKGYLQRQSEQFVDKLIYQMTSKGLLVNLNIKNGMGFLVKYLKSGPKKNINNFTGKIILRVKKPKNMKIISAAKKKSGNFQKYLDKKNILKQKGQFRDQMNESDYQNESLVEGNIINYAHINNVDDDDDFYGQQQEDLIDQMIEQARRKKQQERKCQQRNLGGEKTIDGDQQDQIEKMIRQAKERKKQKELPLDQTSILLLTQDEFANYVHRQKQKKKKCNNNEPIEVAVHAKKRKDEIQQIGYQQIDFAQALDDQNIIYIGKDIAALDQENPQKQYEFGYSPFKKYQYVEGKPGSVSYQKNIANAEFSKPFFYKLLQNSKKIDQDNKKKLQMQRKLKRNPYEFL